MNAEIKKMIKKIVPRKMILQIRSYMEKRTIKKLLRESSLPFDKNAFEKGINLIGPIKHDTGLGQSMRLVARGIESAAIPYSIVYFTSSKQISSTNHSFDHKISGQYVYGINLIHINMHEFARGLEFIGKKELDRRYNIAFWLWEMGDFPQEWIPFIEMMDEIWTPSEFTGNAIRKVTEKKVYTIPYHITAETNTNLLRRDFGLPQDKFLFLMLFDNNSIAERKNPYAVIHAYTKAFPSKKENTALIIKINNASEDLLKKIRELLKGHEVYFIKETLSKEDVNRLIELSDVYVSLHRAEGFGLVLAEAMLLGTPTVATNYSSNTEFQNTETACMVSCKMVEVGKDIYPYRKEDLWAEPNIDEAAAYMKRLYEDREYYKRIKENGKTYIHKSLGLNRIKENIQARFAEIYDIR